jgi:CHASE3 domain sensor protein
MHGLMGGVVVLSTLALAYQERPVVSTATPKDAVIVIGCLKNGVIEDSRNSRSYRLSGKKELLRELQKEHADHTDEVTGTLKSTSALSEPRGKRIGKTTVTARMGETPDVPDIRDPSRSDAMPEIAVTSFRHLDGSRCR